MREIKFRGKRVDNGEWVYGCLVNNLWFKSSDKSRICEIITGKYDGDCWEDIVNDENCVCEVIPETVGQYTGLKDKEGNEIYEGDIVKNQSRTWMEEDDEPPTYDNTISEIIYRDKGFWVKDESFGWEGEDLWDWEYILIIGNIHDNPELLNK